MKGAIMKGSMTFDIRSMIQSGFKGMVKLFIPALFLSILIFVFSSRKIGISLEFALRFPVAILVIGFLWGLRVYEYRSRFSRWKDYIAKKATLAEAFMDIANRTIWIPMIIMAYSLGIAIEAIFYFLMPVIYKISGEPYISKSFSVTSFLLIPASSIFILFGANVFGPKQDEEEEIALKVVSILNSSPKISPVNVESPDAVERFVKGATTEKGHGVEPYFWILSHINSPQTIPVLKSALRNSDTLVRCMAIKYLNRIGGVDSLQLLRECLINEADPAIIQLLNDSIVKLGEGVK